MLIQNNKQISLIDHVDLNHEFNLHSSSNCVEMQWNLVSYAINTLLGNWRVIVGKG